MIIQKTFEGAAIQSTTSYNYARAKGQIFPFSVLAIHLLGISLV